MRNSADSQGGRSAPGGTPAAGSAPAAGSTPAAGSAPAGKPTVKPASGAKRAKAGPAHAPRTAVVLGAGGLVGLAYHAGTLRALERQAGYDARTADLVIGTSAGSIVGAYLRRGLSAGDLYDIALAEGGEPMPRVLENAVRSPLDGVRRGLGSLFVLGQSVAKVKLPAMPHVLRHAFPGGLFRLGEGKERLERELGEPWPEDPLWLVAVDLGTGERVVIGRDEGLAVPLDRAVQASSAIPGVYPPVRAGSKFLVDGGVHSTSNLDLAVAAGCTTIVAIVPMGFDPLDPPNAITRTIRGWVMHSLRGELAEARAAGAKVLVIAPNAAEIRVHGPNLMRREGLAVIARIAEANTEKLLAADRAAGILAA